VGEALARVGARVPGPSLTGLDAVLLGRAAVPTEGAGGPDPDLFVGAHRSANSPRPEAGHLKRSSPTFRAGMTCPLALRSGRLVSHMAGTATATLTATTATGDSHRPTSTTIDLGGCCASRGVRIPGVRIYRWAAGAVESVGRGPIGRSVVRSRRSRMKPCAEDHSIVGCLFSVLASTA
jgi:hypothetical protein